MKVSLLKSGFVYVALLFGITLSGSQSKVNGTATLDANDRTSVTGFVWGGIDEGSYVYWPDLIVDQKPLALVKAGRRQEAFDYCFAKMDTTKGSTKFFYSVQAASMGFGLFKTYLVAEKLGSEYNQVLRESTKDGDSDPYFDTNFLLALNFAYSLAAYSGNDDFDNPKFKPTKKLLDAHPMYLTLAKRALAGRSYSTLAQKAVAATLAFVRRDKAKDWSQRHVLWQHVMSSDPKNPAYVLVSSRFHSVFVGEPVAPGKFDTADKLIVKAYNLNPNYDRAVYQMGSMTMYTKPSESEQFFRRYISMGTGPKYEMDRARANLKLLQEGKR